MSGDRKSDVLATVPADIGLADGRPSVSDVFPEAVQPLPGEHAGLMARAHARLDLFGGLSDFTGGFTWGPPRGGSRNPGITEGYPSGGWLGALPIFGAAA